MDLHYGTSDTNFSLRNQKVGKRNDDHIPLISNIVLKE
jgi:hypothetical protein